MTPETIQRLFPIACQWAEEQEDFILKNGVELTADQQIDAFLVGVKAPTKVRLLQVNTIPLPSLPELETGVQEIGLITPHTIGITFRYGIYVKTGHWHQRNLIVHELAHTMQYERLGGFAPFLEHYLHECLTLGYPFGPLEQEARRIERELCA